MSGIIQHFSYDEKRIRRYKIFEIVKDNVFLNLPISLIDSFLNAIKQNVLIPYNRSNSIFIRINQSNLEFYKFLHRR